MSEFKGTPGPWEVGRVIGCYIEGRNSWSHVCSVMDDHKDSVTEQESIYNRHLIAAAPELLDACKLAFYNQVGPKLANQVKENNWQWPDGKEGLSVVSILAEQLRYVIAKALGEEK